MLRNKWNHLIKELQKVDYSDNYKVYGLIDPISNTLFYIGCTKAHMSLRLSQHYCELSFNRRKNSILKKLIDFDLLPKIHIFFESDNKVIARNLEANLIKFLFDETLTIDLDNKKINILEEINI